MKLARFADVLEIKNGRSQKQVENPTGVYPIYGSGGIMGYANEYLCEAQTVVIGRKGSINNPLFVEEKFWNVDTAFGLEANKDVLFPKYLYYFSKQFNFEKLNTTVTIPSLTKANLLEVEIPLPPLDDQKRIAHLLDKVDGLISKRKKRLQQLDVLLQSVFMQMFGDPVRNEKGWEKESLEALGSLDRGFSKHRPRNAPELLGGKHPLIQTGDVSNAVTYITAHSQTYSDIGLAQSKMWKAGTLCITIAANIAQTAILTFDACFPDSVVGFITNTKKANVYYVLGLFWFFQKILEKNAPAAAQKNINLKILRKLVVPRPPLPLQNQFATIVEKVENIKRDYQHSLDQLERLYGVLSQRAFKGELDLSRVVLPVEAAFPVLQGSAPREVRFDLEEIAQFGYRLAEFAYQAAQAIMPLLVPLAAASIGFQRGLEDAARALQHPKTSQEIFLSPPMPAAGAIENSCHENRTRDIDALLEACIKELGAVPFSVQEFLNAVRQELEDIADDPEQVQGVTLAVYEYIKTWIFRSLERGKLEQFFDDNDNAVYFRHVDAV